MKTWIFDLDGTICTQEKYGSYQDARPVKDVVRKMKLIFDVGDVIIIHTARGMNTFHGDVQLVEKNLRSMTEKWLIDNDVPYHKLVFGKPPGDIYVDDKGINVDDFI